MPEMPKVIKATIVKLDSSGALDLTKSVICHFNPTEFTSNWQIEWRSEESSGDDFPQVTFVGGKAPDMSVELLFDTTDTGKDVRDSYSALLDIAGVDKKQKNSKTQKSAPSRCQFQWGRLLSFDAVITNVAQQFTLFRPDGTPLRAKVTVTFMQAAIKTAGQNPTTRSEPRKTWVVHEGDRLDWIAYREYGNSSYWRHIAEANNLADPKKLRPGQVLQLGPLP